MCRWCTGRTIDDELITSAMRKFDARTEREAVAPRTGSVPVRGDRAFDHPAEVFPGLRAQRHNR
ncbi:hypothetical protein NI17_018245 [Thermobifida halotolerans]|uniref:Uncharacterized protein n=1 Tax=Thermobifida halotolerans TaxID=483545 RepID=A0A399G1K8_9ACTN|nr:hypothetical protein [Thermobifida halotolerans]UOE18714.1 hypothetical protein NI17_018245 [Thermobifida halotolerans]